MEAWEAALVKVAIIADIPRGEGRVYNIQGKEIAIFHLENGEVRAIDGRCPHRNGPLVHGILSGETILCPLHGWKICLQTGQAVGEDGHVTVYPVRMHEGQIFLDVEDHGIPIDDKT